MPNIEQLALELSLTILLAGTVLLVLLALISLKKKRLTAGGKKTLYISIVLASLVPTIFLVISTVYLNVVSVSHGPVHWHADFEMWDCGKEVDLKDPQGFSNKIGTRTLHEHNDKRIHLEGIVLTPDEASLGNFFHVVGGELTPVSLTVPTNNGSLSVHNGDNCGTGVGELQVFVYRTGKDTYYSQEKLINPQEYQISQETNVPPADCIILEFDTPKSRTDKLCRSYKVAEKIGKLKGERHNGY